MGAFWAVVLVLSLTFKTAAAQDWSAPLAAIAQSVLRIEAVAEGEAKPGRCSGVVINAEAGYVLTAAHCFAPRGSITVAGRHAEIARRNTLLDLAIVRIEPEPTDRAVTLAPKTPGIGTPIAIAGFPFDIAQLAVQFGFVALPLNDDSKTLWVNAEIIPGNSGGAVLDIEGRLVGINSRIFYSGPSRMGAAIPVETIRQFAGYALPKAAK